MDAGRGGHDADRGRRVTVPRRLDHVVQPAVLFTRRRVVGRLGQRVARADLVRQLPNLVVRSLKTQTCKPTHAEQRRQYKCTERDSLPTFEKVLRLSCPKAISQNEVETGSHPGGIILQKINQLHNFQYLQACRLPQKQRLYTK